MPDHPQQRHRLEPPGADPRHPRRVRRREGLCARDGRTRRRGRHLSGRERPSGLDARWDLAVPHPAIPRRPVPARRVRRRPTAGRPHVGARVLDPAALGQVRPSAHHHRRPRQPAPPRPPPAATTTGAGTGSTPATGRGRWTAAAAPCVRRTPRSEAGTGPDSRGWTRTRTGNRGESEAPGSAGRVRRATACPTAAGSRCSRGGRRRRRWRGRVCCRGPGRPGGRGGPGWRGTARRRRSCPWCRPV